MSIGKLIVLEGLDGSGKATQTKLLFDALKAKGENVMRVTFPNYDSPSSALVKMYLAGEFGVRIEDTVLVRENDVQILAKSDKNLIIIH